jgi:hypothetical protein
MKGNILQQVVTRHLNVDPFAMAWYAVLLIMVFVHRKA